MSDWVTAADVARRAGVSRSAVSRTFTRGASVSPQTRARVLEAAKELGYRVNMLARSVIQQQSNLVGLVVPGFASPFTPLILDALVQALGEHGMVPLLMDSGSSSRMEESLRQLLNYRVAAAILTSGTPPLELAREYARLQVPVALINRQAGFEGVDEISSDNEGGGVLAARCLMRGGARRLAYVNRPTRTDVGRLRGAGFYQAIGEAGVAGVTIETIETGDAGYRGGEDAARQLFSRPAEQRPDGVFCATDLVAFGLVDAAREVFGLRVPQDVQVVGFDDLPMAAAGAYALTTLRQDVSALAREVVQRLIGRMAEPALAPRTSRIPVSLVERHTTLSR